MGLTVADLRQRINERRAAIHVRMPERIDLGRGIYVEVKGGAVLTIASEAAPDDYAICGYVENETGRWIMYRAWHEELIATFGSLPERVTVEAEAA